MEACGCQEFTRIPRADSAPDRHLRRAMNRDQLDELHSNEQKGADHSLCAEVAPQRLLKIQLVNAWN